MTLNIMNPGYNPQAPTPDSGPGNSDWMSWFLSQFGPSAAQAGEAPSPVAAINAAMLARSRGQPQPQPPDLPVAPAAIPPVPTVPPTPPQGAPIAGPLAAADAAGPRGLAWTHMPAPGQGPNYGMQHAVLPSTPPAPPAGKPLGQGGIGSDANIPLRRTPGAPNMGYYAPMSGNARGAQYLQYQDPNDPRIFKGPLAAR